ncbi:hypothetical protein [Streptomyces sp. NPDC002952]|uniref:SbtR family transcriptional regulator n=1 Tax=Streptomyces sp. NPDC002952 TaxID=3364673 RepID=UPI003673C2B2
MSAFLHRDHRVVEAQRELHGMIEELLAEAARAGAVRNDIVPAELASYCLHALAAAGDLPSEAAVDRLLALTLAGVRPEGAEPSRAPVRTEGTTHPRHHSPGRHRLEPRP